MSRSIQVTLEQLMPRHSGALPPELLDLASSLLAQSRSKCSSLKAEEEIGRAYACANIACERLKTTLNLPKIEPRPPCPPKVYNRLYEYFDKTLLSGGGRKRRQRSDVQADDRVLPQRHTPTKEKSLEAFRTNRTSKGGLKYGSNKKDDRLPRWVGPAIRSICKEMDTTKAIPHVYAGVESVWLLPCPRDDRKDKAMEGKLPALVAAVWTHVVAQLKAVPIASATGMVQRKQLLDILNGLKDDGPTMQKIRNDEGWEAWETVALSHYKSWVAEIAKAWLDFDWFQNIPEGAGVSGNIDNSDAEDVQEELCSAEDILKKRKWQIAHNPRIGRMVHEIFEVDSEKSMEFMNWKRATLADIEVSGSNLDEMDTTSD
ncbi:origin recognition complex, subunit 6 [Bisporella sp. PMI_857]|nr:origin recognition complex, subunit 6 [Bisporella sp. PMI_857]